MRAYLQFLVRTATSNPGGIVAGAAMTVAGVSYQDWIKSVSEQPPEFLTNKLVQIGIISLGVLTLAYIFFSQAQDEDESSLIKKLKQRTYVTFREISDAISQSSVAYTKDEVLRALMKAVWWREFEEISGHSRLRLTLFDEWGHVEERYIVSGRDLLETANSEVMRRIERSTFDAVMRGPSSFAPGFIDSHVETLTIERRDFCRWHKRFKRGRYEMQEI